MRRCWLWCVAGLACATHADDNTDVYAARVTRVFDGDTVWVKPLAGGGFTPSKPNRVNWYNESRSLSTIKM